MDLVARHVHFFKKDTPTFGEREYWKCRICGMSGSDQPGIGQLAREVAEAHFDQARKHFKAVAVVPPEGARYDDLLMWMSEEFEVYGQMSPKDAGVIASQMAHDFYRYEIRQRDEKIEILTQQLREARVANGRG